jgi:hypothetical protein
VSIVEEKLKEIVCSRGMGMDCEEAYMELIFRSSVLYLKDLWFCGCDHDDVNVSLSLSSIRWDGSVVFVNGSVRGTTDFGKEIQ